MKLAAVNVHNYVATIASSTTPTRFDEFRCIAGFLYFAKARLHPHPPSLRLVGSVRVDAPNVPTLEFFDTGTIIIVGRQE